MKDKIKLDLFLEKEFNKKMIPIINSLIPYTFYEDGEYCIKMPMSFLMEIIPNIMKMSVETFIEMSKYMDKENER